SIKYRIQCLSLLLVLFQYPGFGIGNECVDSLDHRPKRFQALTKFKIIESPQELVPGMFENRNDLAAVRIDSGTPRVNVILVGDLSVRNQTVAVFRYHRKRP